MLPRIYPIFTQDLENGQTGEFGVGEDGKAYWNGKPIITEEKVVLQLWVNIALIVTAVAVIVQAMFAGLSDWDSHKVARISAAAPGISDPITRNKSFRLLAAGDVCTTAGELIVPAAQEGVLACIDGKWKPSPDCKQSGQVVYAGPTKAQLVCRAGKWVQAQE